jgi:hypothetical protein
MVSHTSEDYYLLQSETAEYFLWVKPIVPTINASIHVANEKAVRNKALHKNVLYITVEYKQDQHWQSVNCKL